MLPGSKNNSSPGELERLAGKKPALQLRAKVLQALRLFFISHGYLEVETPFLIPAPAPEAHIDAVRAGDAFLHTSPELCMKRLLCAGYPKIFQICACFRNNERGNLHLPQFTLLEWYRLGANYFELMKECEDMVNFVSNHLGMGSKIKCQSLELDLKAPWQRISVQEAFARHASLSMEEALKRESFDRVMVEEIEPKLGSPKPTFLYDYPASHAALARLNKKEPGFAERFELYAAGLELANAFSELTDAEEQKKRFEKEREKRRREGKDVYPMPERFLKALSHMPEAAGIAFGVDRLVMLFADTPCIDKVVAFSPEEL